MLRKASTLTAQLQPRSGMMSCLGNLGSGGVATIYILLLDVQAW